MPSFLTRSSAAGSRVKAQAAGEGLIIDGVMAGYGDVPVLRGVTLEAAPGECVALLGPNGVGKTTTIRTITGILEPSAGRIEFGGRSLVGMHPHEAVRQGIAVVPEGRRLYGGLTVEENLQMGAYVMRRSKARERIAELYKSFPQLAQWRQRLAGSLSGGQQQLCAIGRALVSRPHLLLIDELSMGLSPAAVKEVTEAIETVIATVAPIVLIVDQDVTVGLRLAARGYFLDLGRVVAAGTKEELDSVDMVRDLYFRNDRTSREGK